MVANPTSLSDSAGPAHPAVGGWRLSFDSFRGEERPILALAADGTGHYQSPEGLLPVTATYGSDETANAVALVVDHKTVMTNFKLRFRATIDGDTLDGAMQTVMGPHTVTGTRIPDRR